MDAHPTIVFVDLTGSSAAYEAFDNAVVAGMVSKITRWVARVGKAHGGQTIKFLGDGVLLQFPAGILAVSAAVYLQQHYAEPLGQVPEGMRLGLKIGLASGSIVELHSDSYGDPVNLAARLCDMAGPHDIWADESVFDAELQGQASPSLPAPLPEGVRVLPWLEVRRRPLGLMRVQGLTQPRSVFQVLWNTNVSPDQLTRPGTLAVLGHPRPQRGHRTVAAGAGGIGRHAGAGCHRGRGAGQRRVGAAGGAGRTHAGRTRRRRATRPGRVAGGVPADAGAGLRCRPLGFRG